MPETQPAAAAGAAEERDRHPARLAEPAHAGRVRGPRVRDAEPRPLRRAVGALRQSLHGLAPVHPRATRHPLRRLDFLWKPWGSIELWEHSLTAHLRRAGVTSMLISDHPHLFETGGENYHTDFTAWEYERGHESRPVEDAAGPERVGHADHRIRGRATCTHSSRSYFRGGDGLPRAADDARGGAVDRRQRRLSRPLLPLRRRVRPARAVRHAGAVRVDVRRDVGGAAPDLAAVRHAAQSAGVLDGARRRSRSGRSTAAN